jgi:hypothetical protein
LLPVRKLIEAKKYEEAEAKLLPMFDDMAVGGVWFDFHDNTSPLFPMDKLVVDLTNLLSPIRRQQGKATIEAARGEELPSYVVTVDAICAARDAFAAGKARHTLEGQALDGPALAAHIVNDWQDLYVQTVHRRAMDCALAELKESNDDVSSAQPFGRFLKDCVAALGEMIEADLARASADEVPDLYAAYVEALAPGVSQWADPAHAQTLQAALQKSLEKSPQWAADVSAYGRGTSELLRWRGRFAAAQAKAQPTPPAVRLERSFTAQVPDLVNTTVKKLSDKPIITLPMAGTGRKGVATTPANQIDTYRVRVAPEALQGAQESLRTALLCGDSQRPLTLEAAAAVIASERGDLAAAGGNVTKLQLDAYIPHFFHLSPKMPLNIDRLPPALEGRMRWRLEVEPLWVQQPHAFVLLTKEKEKQ